MTDPDDFYELLGVKPDATSKAIKRAYRQRALETHPDRNTDRPYAHEQFVRVSRAYDTLKNPAQRASYDWRRRWTSLERERAKKHEQGRHETWRSPTRSHLEGPFAMGGALKTVRSFFGDAIDVLGERLRASWIDCSYGVALCLGR